MISQDAAQKILGIEEKTYLTPEEMADKLNITFYPQNHSSLSPHVLHFSEALKKTLGELKANIVPYEESLEIIEFPKRIRRALKIFTTNVLHNFYPEKYPLIEWAVLKNALKRKRIKAGISVIALGEHQTGDLPMDNTSSFRKSSVITIVDRPQKIKNESEFLEHFEEAMNLFAYHMTNIIIAVDEKEWILYNFNASHPIYPVNEKLKENVLHALVPKIAAPIRPHRFAEFQIRSDAFDPYDEYHRDAVNDIIKSGALLEVTGLYPPGRKLDELPFRNNFYRWIGRIHLDQRNGMSYGFLAIQLPTEIPVPFSRKDAIASGMHIPEENDIFTHDDELYLKLDITGEEYIVKVPEVWVLTQRSGCDKTHMDPKTDLIKMGLINGTMYLQASKETALNDQYKPSFDTKVILAHAAGNAIVAAVSRHIGINQEFVKNIETTGMAICHWHGYMDPTFIPAGWQVHGIQNPHVACSSPQSAIYALQGKLHAFEKTLLDKEKYKGDIHIEPHHGTNMTFPSLIDLGNFFNNNPSITTLGNKYLYLYNE